MVPGAMYRALPGGSRSRFVMRLWKARSQNRSPLPRFARDAAHHAEASISGPGSLQLGKRTLSVAATSKQEDDILALSHLVDRT